MKIDGKALAQEIFADIRRKAQQLNPKIIPHLAVITVGDESSWEAYVHQKQKRAQELGFRTSVITLQNTSEDDLILKIQELNENTEIHGIIIQRPLPAEISTERITNSVIPEKDVDGFRSDSRFKPPIWLAVEYILEYIYRHTSPQHRFTQWLTAKKITVIGKGDTAGKPIIKGLYSMNIIPSVIDSQTHDKNSIIQASDIIISGVGKEVIDVSHIKRGAILIGIGIRREHAELKGDFNESLISPIVSWYSPTPGGVGRVNLAFLMVNLLQAAQLQAYH